MTSAVETLEGIRVNTAVGGEVRGLEGEARPAPTCRAWTTEDDAGLGDRTVCGAPARYRVVVECTAEHVVCFWVCTTDAAAARSGDMACGSCLEPLRVMSIVSAGAS